jgi:hypothetical protein
MTETSSGNDSKVWKDFLRRHWGLLAVFVVAAVLAVMGAIYVYLWFVAQSQSTGLVPTTLDQWSMGHLVVFIVYLILWEALLVGIPAAIAAALGWAWWRRIPEDERRRYHFFEHRSRTSGGGGGVSLLVFIAFCIKVYLDGRWNVAIGTWTFDYIVYSLLWTLIWLAIIFGIPATIALLAWLRYEMNKKP